MDLLTFAVDPADAAVLERLATGGVDLGRTPFQPMDGQSRVASPPALTPVLKRFDSAYIGLWRHPLVSGRTPSYVEYVWETSRAREVATTVDQLVAWLFVVLLETVDDPETDRHWPQLVAAASTLGLDDLDGFYDATLEGAESLASLPAFAAAAAGRPPPRDATTTPRPDYRGEFARADAPEAAATVAGCEVPVDADPSWIAAAARVAPWLAPGSPVAVFGDLLAAGDTAGAWLALNSPGWPVEQVEHALEQLTATVADDGLRLLADDWLARTDRRTGGY